MRILHEVFGSVNYKMRLWKFQKKIVGGGSVFAVLIVAAYKALSLGPILTGRVPVEGKSSVCVICISLNIG